jgi:hypothetical protein
LSRKGVRRLGDFIGKQERLEEEAGKAEEG